MKCLKIFIFILFISSCSNRTAIPNDIIPPDSMMMIMKDIFYANEYTVQYIAKDSLKPDKVKASQDLLEEIFKIHHTKKEDFRKSLKFYESRPDLNKNIFDSLAAYANRHKSELFMPNKPLNPTPVHNTPGKPKSIPLK